MKYTLSCLLFCCPILSAAQVTQYAPVIFGTEIGAVVARPNEEFAGVYPNYDVFRFAPQLGFRVAQQSYLGVGVTYGFGKYEFIRLPAQKGFRLLAKHYFKHKIENRFLQNNLQVYSELSWGLQNFRFDHTKLLGYEILNGYNNHEVQGLLGLNFRLSKSLYLDYAWRTFYYPQQSDLLLASRLGIQYHFGENRIYTPRPDKSNPLLVPSAPRQKRLPLFDFRHFLRRATVSASYSFVFDEYDRGDFYYYKQTTAALSMLISLSSDIDVGLSIVPVSTVVRGSGRENFLLFGVLGQYDFARRPTIERGYVEFGFYKGNMCVCGEDVPYKQANLSYLPLGLGYERRVIGENLFASVTANWWVLINEPRRSGDFILPTVALKYRFFRPL